MWINLILFGVLAIGILPDQAQSQGFCGLCTPDCTVNLLNEYRRLSIFNNSLYYLETLTLPVAQANTTCTSLFSRPAWPGLPGNLATIQSTEELNFVKPFFAVTMDSFVCKIACSDGVMNRPSPAGSASNIYNINISNSPFNELSFDINDNGIDSEGSKHIIPDNTECQDENYRTLEELSRSINFGGVGSIRDVTGSLSKSTSWEGAGWYRVVEPAGTKIPETPPGRNKCGTGSTGWLRGSHPNNAGESKEVSFCFANSQKDCGKAVFGKVTNCGNFFVYKLQEAQLGGRYCAQ